MDIKSEVKQLVMCVALQQDARTSGNTRAVEYYEKFVRQSLDAIDRWADMAEAAVALAEYQATSGYDSEVDSMTYTAERGRLWHAFIVARAKAKEACKSLAGEGET